MNQLSTAIRNAMLEAVEIIANGQSLGAGTGSGGSVTGTAAAPKLQVHTGSMPANCAAARTGTKLVDSAIPANWMADASGGSKAIASGPWAVTGLSAAGAGTVGTYYSIMDSAGTTCHEQGTFGVSVVLATSASTAAKGNALTFSAATGVVAGMNVAGTGVPAGATVVDVTGGVVTLSHTSTAGVSSGASITFSYDMAVDNASIANGQTLNVTAKTLTAPNA